MYVSAGLLYTARIRALSTYTYEIVPNARCLCHPPQKRGTYTRSFRISAHAPLHARPRIAPRPGPTPLTTAREQKAAHGSHPVGSMRAMRGEGGKGGGRRTHAATRQVVGASPRPNHTPHYIAHRSVVLGRRRVL